MTALRRRIGAGWRTLSGAVVTATAPGKARFVGAVAPNSAAADVSWRPPFSGGSAITGYRITVSPGGATHDYGAGVTSATITGLTNDTAYTFTIHATNAVGNGPESDPTSPVTPSASALIRRTIANTGPLGVFDSGLGRKLTYSDLTPHSGSYELQTPGVTYHRVHFSQVPYIGANNITFDQCLIEPPYTALYAVQYRLVSGVKPLGTLFVDTEINGNGIDWDGVTTDGSMPGNGDCPSAAIAQGLSYTMRRCRVRGSADGLKSQNNLDTGPILVEDSLIHGLCFPYLSHSDILQIAGNGAEDVTVRRTTLDGLRTDLGYVAKRYSSSSLMQWGSYPKNPDGSRKGILRNILLEDLFVDGGTYATRPGFASAAVADDVVLRRIRFGLSHRYGVISPDRTPAGDGGVVQIEDCVWDESGTADNGAVVVAGQSVV